MKKRGIFFLHTCWHYNKIRAQKNQRVYQTLNVRIFSANYEDPWETSGLKARAHIMQRKCRESLTWKRYAYLWGTLLLSRKSWQLLVRLDFAKGFITNLSPKFANNISKSDAIKTFLNFRNGKRIRDGIKAGVSLWRDNSKKRRIQLMTKRKHETWE